jgi:hypothetical protein
VFALEWTKSGFEDSKLHDSYFMGLFPFSSIGIFKEEDLISM